MSSRVTHSISLQPLESLALHDLAERDHRGNRSAAVAELLREAMLDRYGVTWEALLTAQEQEGAAA